MAIFGAITGIVGGMMQAQGAKQQAEAQAQAAEYNAQVQERNAASADQQGQMELQQRDRNNRRALATIRAAYGSNGLDGAFGSPLDVITDTAYEQARDENSVYQSATVRGIGYRDQAALDRAEASNDRAAGDTAAASAIFGGISGAGSSLLKGFSSTSGFGLGFG